jgi:hypothetical protein
MSKCGFQGMHVIAELWVCVNVGAFTNDCRNNFQVKGVGCFSSFIWIAKRGRVQPDASKLGLPEGIIGCSPGWLSTHSQLALSTCSPCNPTTLILRHKHLSGCHRTKAVTVHGVRPSRHSCMAHTDRALSVWGPAGPKPYAVNLWAMSAAVSAAFFSPLGILLSSEPTAFKFSD